MRKYLNQISNLLNKKQITLLSISSLLLLIVTILETVGLGSIAGFIYLVSDPDLIISKLSDGAIKDYITSKDINSIIFLSLILLIIFFVLKNLLIIFYHYWTGILKKNINISNSQRLLKYYFSKNYSFFIENSSQKLINNLSGEIQRSTHYLFFTLILIKEVLLIFSLLITLLFVSWKLSSTLFIILGFFSLIFYFVFKKFSKKLGESITQMSESILRNLSESIYNAKLIKLFDIKNFFIKKIVNNIEKKNTNELHQSIINLLPRFILEIIAVSLVASIICYFVLNDYTFQSIISLITLMTLFIVRLVPAFTNISTARSMLKFYETSFLNISKQLAEESFGSIKENKRDNISKIKFESIKVKNLSHQYVNQKDLFLKDINFEIVKGDTVAIIGETGAGKSTLINILLGLISPNKGEMIFNEKNVYENIYDWQSLIGYVPQDTYLMNESIKNNVAFGLNKDLIDKDQLDYSLSKANIKNFIDTLEDGVETICGDNGINFSGGQRQRIGIARALYRDPQILIFDESTSSLDIDTEKELLGDLFTLDKKTIIIVSHRLNIIKNCNKILLLKSGKVLDFGKTDEVVKRNNYLLNYI